MKKIRIGTRDSELALWQATTVQKQIEYLGFETELVPVKALGDLKLDEPIYELGVTGVFTKNLDIALIKGEIDIAVHSMKDVPTQLPKGMIQGAVLKRGLTHDVLVFKGTEDFFAQKDAVIATGSLRRKAAWLDRYPSHRVVGLRGNVNTRMAKLEENQWNGAIFAAAGLKRIGIKAPQQVNLDWMLPAPAQGAVMITLMDENEEVREVISQLNHEETALVTKVERDFLRTLEGGCTAPIGAQAYVNQEEGKLVFEGVLFSKDGSRKLTVAKKAPLEYAEKVGVEAANDLIERGAKRLILKDLLDDAEFKLYSTKKLSEKQKELIDKRVGVGDSDFIKIRSNRIAKKQLPSPLDHVIISSKNGLESLLMSFNSDELEIGQIHCVGRRTKKLIEQRLGKVTTVAPNAKALVEKLKDLKDQEVTYFCGEDRLDIIPNALAPNNNYQELAVYKTMLSPEKIDETYKAVLFFSPSGVQSFISKNDYKPLAVCIGDTTAQEARKYFDRVEVAKMPNVESMLGLANEIIRTEYLDDNDESNS